MLEIFKTSKGQPIKFRNFQFIGWHPDYPVAYYYKQLPRDNYELLECVVEGAKKPEVGPGTSVKVLDAFMTNYLAQIAEEVDRKPKEFIEKVIETTYGDFDANIKSEMIKKFTSPVPKEIKESRLFKELLEDGFTVLYCSNDESEDRKMGVVNITLYKNEHVVSKDERIAIDRKFTIFKPLRYRVLPSYLKSKSKTKYMEEEHQPIIICHDILK